jgi:uncharacterized protein (TIGR00255 family)
MITSMTGYATATGEGHGYRWTWELRAVNGKGLDLRLRVPDWIDGLETALRAQITKAAARGNITLSCRVGRDGAEAGLRLNNEMLGTVIAAMMEVETRARASGLSLSPATAADIVALRGVLEQGSGDDDTGPLKAALIKQMPDLLAAFNEMRQGEGARMAEVLSAQIAEVARLTEAASALTAARQHAMQSNLRRNLAKVMDGADGADAARVAQELAIIAVKSDIMEEIDRLRAHVAAARDLLSAGGPVGRKFDFLMQEFNREANTLCAKAQMTELTETGLALKVVIDQMREQVQNVE